MKAVWIILSLIIFGFIVFFIWDFYRKKQEEENRMKKNEALAKDASAAVNQAVLEMLML